MIARITDSIGFRMLVIRAIHIHRARSIESVHMHTAQMTGAISPRRALERMEDAGLIERKDDGYHATRAGLDILPPDAPRNWTPLRIQPAPPRREGSMDFAKLPSVAAGIKRQWKPPT